MTLEQFARHNGHTVEQFDYGDERVVAIDFGAGAEASVDVVGDTVIVVFGDEQREFDLPSDAADAHTFMRNGVLTIEMETPA